MENPLEWDANPTRKPFPVITAEQPEFKDLYSIIKESYITSDLIFMNPKLDAAVEQELIRVKTCREYVAQKGRGRHRAGSFIFEPIELQYMKVVDGIFLLIVVKDCIIGRIGFIRAKDIPNKRQIMWKNLFNGGL